MNSPTYALDIETDTSISETSGLDPRVGGVTSVALSLETEIIVLDLETCETETKILSSLQKILTKDLSPGVLTTWNGSVFDLPFLQARMYKNTVLNDLKLYYDASLPVKYAPTPGFLGGYRAVWGEHKHCDIAKTFKLQAEKANISWSLKPVARFNGLNPIEVDRVNMHLLTPQQERDYVASDAIVTRELKLLADDSADLTVDIDFN